MNSMLCGHERDVLREALRAAALSGHEWSAAMNAPSTADARVQLHDAYRALGDPAKLAEMMASEGRRLGFSAEYVDYEKRFESLAGVAFYANEDWIFVEDGDAEHVFTAHQARALLHAWLDLPDGDVDGALRALGGET